MAIEFPFSDANQVVAPDLATFTVTIEDTFTIVNVAAGFAQAVTALSIARAPEGVKVGTKVRFDFLQNGTGRNITFGSAGDTIVAPVLTGVADDRDVIELVWDDTEWVASSDWFKVVDAA